MKQPQALMTSYVAHMPDPCPICYDATAPVLHAYGLLPTPPSDQVMIFSVCLLSGQGQTAGTNMVTTSNGAPALCV